MKCMVITFFDREGLAYTHCSWWLDNQCRLVRRNPKMSYYGAYPCKRPHYLNGYWKLHHSNTHLHIAQRVWFLCDSDSSHFLQPWPRTLWFSPVLQSITHFSPKFWMLRHYFLNTLHIFHPIQYPFHVTVSKPPHMTILRSFFQPRAF